ncbi:lysosomal alpha-mannosidase-like [Belonocnema kinseyi]|uniref:lysosomal alpha-mannosidase-like n=1 Tax=Belonocnema kinseyi TaxID=2817044 RepID=UPI00143D6B38|nr:lysosomal alpha-mannosidase-like [Belonocnema kinseyi]
MSQPEKILRIWFSIILSCVIVIILVTTRTFVILNNRARSTTCGYEACAEVDPKKLNVHIVPHSHDDVGWLKTFDQYYYGSRKDLYKAGVHYILKSVIQSLQENPDRRFIFVESAFFFKWWDKQDEEEKTIVRSLINEGRLEIIGGGWSMNDEAVTHYQSVIDQFSWGFRRLNDTFGECARPKIGWQIDPFGHSREQASMFAQMGFDGLIFARLDYQDEEELLRAKTAEFIWKGSSSLGKSSNLFTSKLYQNYSSPYGLCFDTRCKDDPLIDDTESPEYNIVQKVEQLLAYVNKQAYSYRTNNVLLTMGDDFQYHLADMWFINLDLLIRYTNQRNGSTHNLIYSTPSCYLKALNDANLAWSTKSDDFFPYASDYRTYWTGYYTSRPTLKFYARMGNNFLQVIKQLSVLRNYPDNKELEKFREAMGILQHHDAITGTERQHVANDYARILSISMRDGEEISTDILRNFLPKDQSSEQKKLLKFHSCLLLNISSCEHTEINKNFVVTVYNPTSQLLTTYVRLPVKGASYNVKNYLGTELVTQIVPVPEAVKTIPGRNSSALYELVFLAQEIPAMGYQSFYVSEKNSEIEFQSDEQKWKTYDISVDATGKVFIQSKLNESIKLTQSFHYYLGAKVINGAPMFCDSGAYIFRPNKGAGIQNFSFRGNFQIIRGPLVDELHMTVNDWISQVVRVYAGEDRIEFNWLVGPINISDDFGKEIITKYTTDLQTNGEFLTDSNGREILKRMRKVKQSTATTEFSETVAGNYYPVTTKISLNDESRKLKMAVLTDRAQGGSSLMDGEIELMVHRRLLTDDCRGLGQALNETAYGTGLVARGEHSLIIGRQSDAFVIQEKNEAIRLSLRPWIFITPLESKSYDDWKKNYKMQSFGLAKALPPNIHILTLEPWKDGSVLLRIEHLFESDESVELSTPVTINIQDLFADFTITSVRETTLGGNQWLEDSDRLKWVPDEDYVVKNNYILEPIIPENKMVLVLMPMQIRTFIVDVLPYVSSE